MDAGRWQEVLPEANEQVFSRALNNYWFTNFAAGRTCRGRAISITVRRGVTVRTWIGLMLLGALALPAAAGAANTDWMRAGKYGVFFHYLQGGPEYQKAVDSFNVDRFAEQAASTGAAWVVLTLGQNSGYYCSPNATYERIIGCAPHARCSRRDLPMEVSKALAKRHIRLMLYLPSRAPQQDPQAMAALGDVNEGQPAPQVFTAHWSDVIREWSTRYGPRVSGWWFDGAYNTAGWDDLSQPANWNTWAAACRAGSPKSILAFNPGTDLRKAFGTLCATQDYTAGEQNDWTATPSNYPAPAGKLWHVLSFLGSTWARPDGPKHSDEQLIDYVKRVTAAGGAVTMDVSLSPDGQIYPPGLSQLIALRKAIRGK